MKTRNTKTHKKNGPFLLTKNGNSKMGVTEFFSHPGEVHTMTLDRLYDEYTSDLNEDWTFIGESEDWELISKNSTAV